MKKLVSFICIVFIVIVSSASVMNAQDTEDIDIASITPVGQPEQDEYFYILDENGNVEYVTYDSYAYDESLDAKERSAFRNAKYQVAKITGYTTYTEAATGLAGYTHGNSATDAAYIQTNSNGTVRVKQAGVVMDIPKANVSIVDYTGSNVSTYTTSNGKLYHNFFYNQTAKASNWVGYQQGYMASNATYYSYDGHYFYTKYETMIDDYRNNTYQHAINPNTPYYSYYQFLSHRSNTGFAANMFDNRIIEVQGQGTSSKLRNAGKDFISAQNTYGVNAGLMWAVSINESGWGLSQLSLERNNLFGHKAYDSNVGAAERYNSVLDCVNTHAKTYISSGYLDPTDYRYRGPHLGDKQSGINVKYASDPYWGEKAAQQLYLLAERNNRKDYGSYSLGSVNGSANIYNSTGSSKKLLYTTGSGENRNLDNNMVIILGEERGSDGVVYYKIPSDSALTENRVAINPTGIYKTGRDYAYIRKSDVKVVSQGSSVLDRLGMRQEGSYVLGLKPNTSVQAFTQNVKAIDTNTFVNVKNASGQVVTSGTMGTGMTFTLKENGVLTTYTVVIKGDVDGDGQIRSIDYSIVKNDILNIRKLSKAYATAGDVDGDGKIRSIDYSLIKNDILNIKDIVQ